MTRKTTMMARVILAIVFLSPAAAAALDVREVRLYRAPDHTRIVFDLSAPGEHRLIQLSDPERIVVDLSGARLQAEFPVEKLHNTPILRIRSGVRNGADLRVVLDMKAKVSPRSFPLKKNAQRGDRLVLDLYDQDPDAAAAPKVTKSAAHSSRRDIVIAIDAGHGGDDPGAIGPGGLREKDVVLRIAKELASLFKKEAGFQAKLVRTGDYYVGLGKRRAIARAAQADLLASIHADSFKNTEAKGGSVYTLSQRGAASSTFAKFLAERENAADFVGGVSLREMDGALAETLYDMRKSSALDASRGLAGQVLGEMGRVAALHSPKVERAAFVVLKAPDIPSILVETGFISNPGEAKRLRTRAHQRKIARAIHRGIRDWFIGQPPENTLLAWWKQAGGREYVIARGDTLSEIAQRFNVPMASIRAANSLSGDAIRAGQKLKIPLS